MAWVIATIWASVNDPCIGEPRCPLVPNMTNWFGSPRSGLRSKYSRSSRAGSISISFGAGLPASGEIATWVFLSFKQGAAEQSGLALVGQGNWWTRQTAPLAACYFHGNIRFGVARAGQSRFFLS